MGSYEKYETHCILKFEKLLKLPGAAALLLINKVDTNEDQLMCD